MEPGVFITFDIENLKPKASYASVKTKYFLIAILCLLIIFKKIAKTDSQTFFWRKM
jgi:hypothetical protein